MITKGIARARLAPLTSLLGREREVRELAALLTRGDARLVTLVGPGGVGKTRLALDVVDAIEEAWADGACVVPLAPVPAADLVGTTIAQHLDLGTMDDRSPLERLSAFLAESRLLLVLDNFEHVLPAAGLVGDLLRAAPGLTVLVTSRAPLRLIGERVIELAPFSVAELGPEAPLETIREHTAVRLFLERASAAGARIEASELPAVAAICRQLDGLPLALELAAAQTRGLPLTAILQRLGDRAGLQAEGPSDAPPRHRTMEASVTWSEHLLTPAQRQLFHRLAVFTGGFTVEMAAELAKGRAAGSGYPWGGFYDVPFLAEISWGINPTVERLEGVDRRLDHRLPLPAIAIDPHEGLRALVDQSLIRLSHGRDGTPRYEMLETIRAFGLARLRESGDEEAVRHAHAVLACAFVDASAEGLWTKLLRRWEFGRIEDELGNVRTALAWLVAQGPAGAELAMRTANGLVLFWQLAGLVDEGRDWLARALALGPGSGWIRAGALTSFAMLCWIQGKDEQAAAALREAKEIAHGIGMRLIVAQATFYQAMLAWRRGDYAGMRARLDEAFPIFGDWPELIGVGACHLAYGVYERVHGNPAAAERHFEDARVIHELVGYEWGVATAKYYAAELARDRRDVRAAAELLRESLRLYWRIGDFWGSGACAGSLATLAAARGHWLVAARLFGASRVLCERVGALLPPTELRTYARVAETTRAQLGDALYTQVVAEAQRSSAEQCYALGIAAAAGLLGEAFGEPWSDEANDETRALTTLAGLTRKRRDILRLVVQGKEIKEIAHALGRDYNTVDGQLKAIQRAFGVETRTDLIIFCYRNGIADLV